MKLATLNDGSRDGQLIVVSRDLATAHVADGIAPTLQRALDDWGFVAPQLETLSAALNHGRARHGFPFDPRRCLAPLPRAFQWLRVGVDAGVPAQPGPANDAPAAGSAAQATRDAGLRAWAGRGDGFAAPFDDAAFASEDWDIDVDAAIAAIVDDTPAGAGAEQCAARIRLLMLAGDWCLRTPPRAHCLVAARVASRPGSVLGPVAATPDELGDAWRDACVHLPALVHWNGMRIGAAAGVDAPCIDFGRAIADLVRTRALAAGAVVAVDAPPFDDAARGAHGIAGRRAREGGVPDDGGRGYARFGDRVRIEMLDARGASVFGAIEQHVRARAG